MLVRSRFQTLVWLSSKTKCWLETTPLTWGLPENFLASWSQSSIILDNSLGGKVLLFSSTRMPLLGYCSGNWSRTITFLNFVLLMDRQVRARINWEIPQLNPEYPGDPIFYTQWIFCDRKKATFSYVIRTLTATGWQEIISDPSTFSLSVFFTISSSFSMAFCVSGSETKAIL